MATDTSRRPPLLTEATSIETGNNNNNSDSNNKQIVSILWELHILLHFGHISARDFRLTNIRKINNLV